MIVDAYDTWWGKGRSYLCRMVDMLHMGLVDEVLFGREVVTRIPELADEWLALRSAGVAGDHWGDPAALQDPGA
ncbi:DUF7687 domain-containing protein [Mycetocola miduiensis]|uniref:DUF7687 domain-containing protein n=1 Tax=Mycetocola miduiensis TaxID=995034 RepID=UPI0015A52FE9|nr:hypothetical protein [Mycetocola miduiensis]